MVVTCFLFVKYLNAEGCLSLSLSQHGEIIAPLAVRSFEEIQQLQKNANTIIVASTEHFGLHRVELPLLLEKKAQAAIPYALENKLADNVEELHFAFDRKHYHDGHYLVAVCKIAYLTDLITILDSKNLDFDMLTLDWFALDNNEACVLDSGLLVRDNYTFWGALSLDLAPIYLKKPGEQTLYTFSDSDTSLPTTNATHQDINASLWIAKRLQIHTPLNLGQGRFQHGNSQAMVKRWYIAALVISFLWLMSVLVGNGIRIYSLNVQTKKVDANIATIYRQFFPNAVQIINPRFRIGQLLKSTKNNSDNAFWLILNQLTKAIKANKSTVEQLRFQNQLLQVTVVCKDFNALEVLQTYLQKARVNVRQTQASSREGKVIATLELSL